MVPVSTADFWALGQSPDSPGRLVEFGYRTGYRRAALCLQRVRPSDRSATATPSLSRARIEDSSVRRLSPTRRVRSF
jgi:hypothetical protein